VSTKSTPTALEPKLQKLEDDYTDALKKIEALEKQKAEFLTEEAKLNKDVDDLDKDNIKLRTEIETLQKNTKPSFREKNDKLRETMMEKAVVKDAEQLKTDNQALKRQLENFQQQNTLLQEEKELVTKSLYEEQKKNKVASLSATSSNDAVIELAELTTRYQELEDKYEKNVLDTASSQSESSTTIKQLMAQISKMTVTNQVLEADVNATKTIREQCYKEAEALELENADLRQKAAILATQVTNLCDELEKNRKQIKKLEEEVNELGKALDEADDAAVKATEDIRTRDADLDQVIKDTEVLVAKLLELGVKVQLTESGTIFQNV